MRDKIKKLLFEVLDNTNTKVLPAGTTLFHGTVEEFDKERVRPGGYDGLFWTTDRSAIAQTYISVSSMLYTQTRHITEPTTDKTTRNIQKQLGIVYDYNNIEFRGHQALSWKVPPVFSEASKKHNEISDRAWQKYQEMKGYEAFAKEKEKKHETDIDFDHWLKLEAEYEEIRKEEREADLHQHMNRYVNEQLEKLGYKPMEESRYDQNAHWRLLIDNDQLQPANYRSPGRLFIVKLKKEMKIYDATLGGGREGDLTDRDYHRHDWFLTVKKEGYDGIEINDFAQSSDYGNVGHTSIGFFSSSLKHLQIDEVPAVHNDLKQHFETGDFHSPEYKKYLAGK